ncbi:transcription termination/antitermination protein NusA [Sulfuricurvum sp. IAE1]|jgi:N utilization substance protein A|uniref:transcription termination factor NusA n=1 Tax=Sulfuricurvum sp. IAE1 TaxID=2546102 RepID=UPI001051475B|nr:transcription termination factor NusA [Sulfuricurvum sp. IAE1]MDD3769556.1 transcription termination factor NusA [Sulfuricurvum sp.]MDX9965402.1 transcription termination factor NusA [Sulfuricurvum sp.]TDA62772.1 transcription termination/antitermination protein NusA [Sulfuricurvum sp. IAE1]
MENILDIIDSIANEKGLSRENVKEAIKTSFIQTAKRIINPTFAFEADIDERTKQVKLRQIITVVPDDAPELEGEEAGAYMSLSNALEIDEDAEIGDQLQMEHDIESYGRSAFATLHREIEFHIQRLVENELYDKYKSKINQIVSGRVTRVDEQQNTTIEIDEIRAVLPMKNRIKGEKFKVGDMVSAIVRRVHVDKINGISMELSRTSPKFLEELLALEVPEIKDGIVVIEKCARIPGERAKIALYTNRPQIDPIGATVGVRGVRINAVSEELCGENIDCVEYTPQPELFISRAMSPAIISAVAIEETEEGEKKAIVTLPSDQKSKAIGKSGINIRLASMLTGYTIELNEQGGTAAGGEKAAEEKKEGISSLEALFGN